MARRNQRLMLCLTLAGLLCPALAAWRPAPPVDATALEPEFPLRPGAVRRVPAVTAVRPATGNHTVTQPAPRPATDGHSSTQPVAKPVTARHTGTRRALVLFAGFAGETAPVPAWAEDLFDPDLPGSFRHFYHTMSFGRLQMEGAVAPRRYLASQPATAYLADDDFEPGQYGRSWSRRIATWISPRSTAPVTASSTWCSSCWSTLPPVS